VSCNSAQQLVRRTASTTYGRRSAYTGVGCGGTPAADIASSTIVTARRRRYSSILRSAAFLKVWLRFPGALGTPTSVYHSLRLLACGYPRWPIAARLLGACQLLSDAVSVNHILASQTATNHPSRNHRRSLALNDSRLQQGLAGYLRPKPSSLQSSQHWLTSTPSFQGTRTSFSRSTAVAQSSTKFEFSVPRLRRTVKTWAFWSNCTSHSLHAHTRIRGSRARRTN
jgi:hypothetical protein